jgi:Superinfection immunity protein
MATAAAIILMLVVVVAALGAHFMPTIVAWERYHNNRGAIFVLNVLLGWTLIGWVVALVGRS